MSGFFICKVPSICYDRFMDKKTCIRCNETKTAAEFGLRRDRGDLLNPRCRQCERDRKRQYMNEYRAANRERSREISREHYRRNKIRRRSQNRQSKYGVSDAVRDLVFADQGHCCGVCGSSQPGPKDWSIDHCHATGKFRGVLCHSCNTGLGLFYDSVQSLEAAIAYLKKHQG